MLNAVTATGDGTVMTTIAVTRTSTTLNSLLLTVLPWIWLTTISIN